MSKRKTTGRRWRNEDKGPSVPRRPRRAGRPDRQPAHESLQMMSIGITYDYVPDPAFEALPPDLRQEIDGLFHAPRSDYSDVIPQLEDWIQRGAAVPRLYNLLFAGYTQARRHDDARRIVLETCQRFPDYLFGRFELARLSIADGHPEQVREVLGGSYSLNEIVPDREVFHISEVRAWAALLCEMHAEMGEFEHAAAYPEMISELDPGHPVIEHLQGLIKRCALRQAIEQFAGKFGVPPPRKRSPQRRKPR